MNRLWAVVLSWLQHRCTHPPQTVTADVLEGDALPTLHRMVRWCRLCGAYQQVLEEHRTTEGILVPGGKWAWNPPHPEWYL